MNGKVKQLARMLALAAALCLSVAGLALAAGQGSYQLVGLGPGAADLMTPRQLAAIEAADIVFCDDKTKQMLAANVDLSGKEIIGGYGLAFPYFGKDCAKVPAEAGKRWGKSCEEFHKLQAEFVAMVQKAVAQGKKVVMTSGGDPTIYGPGVWTLIALKDLQPTVVPGLSALNAGNAALKASLGEVIITAPFDKPGQKDSIENMAGQPKATMVIYMPRDMDKLLARLAKAYPADTPVGVVENAGGAEKQKVALGTIADIGRKLGDMKAMNCLVYVGQPLAKAQFNPADTPGAQSGQGKYYLVGMGPGDADLATLRALEVIKKADLIFVGRGMKERFAKELAGKNVVEGYYRLFPFYGQDCSKIPAAEKSRERMSCEEYQQKQAEFAAMVRQAVAKGQTVAMLDSGDPLIYGPCSWSLIELRDIPTEAVPGMSCFNAANAAVGAGITEGKSSHSVLLASGWSVEEMAKHQAAMVLFTMRTEFKKFVDALLKSYPPETPVAIVFSAGYAKEEHVLRGALGGVLQQVEGQKLPFEHLLYVGDFLTNDSPY
ncbi:SAM-dependent methyltransferase [Desulfarculus baarsii]